MKKTVSEIAIYVILIIMSIIMIVPFLWMILTAFKTVAETMQVDPFVLVPKVWQVENFGKVVAAMDFVKLFKPDASLHEIQICYRSENRNS